MLTGLDSTKVREIKEKTQAWLEGEAHKEVEDIAYMLVSKQFSVKTKITHLSPSRRLLKFTLIQGDATQGDAIQKESAQTDGSKTDRNNIFKVLDFFLPRFGSLTLDTPLQPNTDSLIPKSKWDIAHNFKSMPDSQIPLHGP